MPLLLLCARSKICQRHEHILCLRIGFVKITVKSQLPQISKSTTSVHPCFEVNTVSSTLERLNVISLKLKRNKTFYRFLNVKKCLQTVQYHHELLTIPTCVHKSTNCASEQRISRNEREQESHFSFQTMPQEITRYPRAARTPDFIRNQHIL